MKYYCVVRASGKCDSLTKTPERAEYLLNLWARCYPERGYKIEIRMYA